MVSILKATGNGETGADMQAIMSDIASLRSDVAALTSHLGSNAVNATSEAAGKLGTEASRVYGNLAEQGQRSAKAVSKQVEEQPLATLLIAFALGFVGNRLLSRSGQ